jgi:hypothetical protein
MHNSSVHEVGLVSFPFFDMPWATLHVELPCIALLFRGTANAITTLVNMSQCAT